MKGRNFIVVIALGTAVLGWRTAFSDEGGVCDQDEIDAYHDDGGDHDDSPKDTTNGFFVEGAPSTSGVPKIYYETIGDPSKPAIVFLADLNQSGLTFDRQWNDESLRAKFFMVRMDYRGHGKSDKLPAISDYNKGQLYAYDLNAVITAAKLNRPVLVGVGYGPSVELDYVQYYGQSNLAGLMLVSGKNGSPNTFTPQALKTFGRIAKATTYEASVAAVHAYDQLGFLHPLSTQEDLELLGMMVLPPQNADRGIFSRVNNTPPILESLTVPVMIIHGRQDAIVKVAAADWTASFVPQATKVIYDDCGSHPNIEQTERFNRDMTRFVRTANGIGDRDRD